MSYKFDSLMRILNMLDRKERVTVQSLMDDLRISERSTYRYVTTLKDADFPIIFDRERGTYAFEEGYSLSKPDLTLEEILAFSLARKLLGNFGPGMENTLDQIEKKLSIKKAETFKDIVFSREEFSAKVGEYLFSIHQAARNFQKIALVYRALYSDEVTKRKVNPYYLFYQDDLWHFRGYCNLRKEFRTFALDRIESMKLLDEYFVPERIPQEDELAGAFGTYIDGEPEEVVLRFDEEIKQYILRKKWHKSQNEKLLHDGRIELTFTVNGIEGIKQWIYKWLPYVEVIEPEELKVILLEDLTRAIEINVKK
jgi:predicted DNA-binding transcriptional regulator YafY